MLMLLVGANTLRQLALDEGVHAVELTRRGQRLCTCAEEHRVDDAKGGVKATDRIVHQAGVLLQRGGDPGMGQLQQRGPAGTKEDSAFAIDAPSDRLWAEEAVLRFAG